MQRVYTTLGHVTIDVLADGSRRPGGTAFYSALQAARLGLRARILTRGVAAEIEQLLAPWRQVLEVEVEEAASTTTLQTSGHGGARSQRMLAWAGPLAARRIADTGILHLAPVAAETPARPTGAAAFVGLTPQGLVRRWGPDGSQVTLARSCSAEDERLARGCDAIVLSTLERDSCAGLIAAARAAGAVVAITAGGAPASVMVGEGAAFELAVPSVADARGDLGAGDVFAAALFVALAEGLPAGRAGAFAAAAAAVRMRGDGAEAIGGREEIERLLREGAPPGR